MSSPAPATSSATLGLVKGSIMLVVWGKQTQEILGYSCSGMRIITQNRRSTSCKILGKTKDGSEEPNIEETARTQSLCL